MKPIRTDNGVPVFTTRDIDDYGFPENYGYTIYTVIESRELQLVTDFKTEQQYDLRPIHRYSRIARFKSTLYQLLGERGSVPPTVMAMVKAYLVPNDPDPWNSTRWILKHFKQSQYYNRIPFILNNLLGKNSHPTTTPKQLDTIIAEYMAFALKFETTKHSLGLRYFPNMRFIVFKLLQKHALFPNYPIPIIRTERKRRSLEKLWDSLQ